MRDITIYYWLDKIGGKMSSVTLRGEQAARFETGVGARYVASTVWEAR